jgi:hypothetical protein
MEVRQRSRLSHFIVIFFVIMARDQTSQIQQAANVIAAQGQIVVE